jgi:hypothetical protein
MLGMPALTHPHLRRGHFRPVDKLLAFPQSPKEYAEYMSHGAGMSLKQPPRKMGYADKFGTPQQQRDLSAVRHIARNKLIPPFLILHVADNTDTTAQAHRLWIELHEAGIEAKMFGAAGTDHVKLDRDLGVPGDPSTAELFAFVDAVLKR